MLKCLAKIWAVWSCADSWWLRATFQGWGLQMSLTERKSVKKPVFHNNYAQQYNLGSLCHGRQNWANSLCLIALWPHQLQSAGNLNEKLVPLCLRRVFRRWWVSHLDVVLEELAYCSAGPCLRLILFFAFWSLEWSAANIFNSRERSIMFWC